MQLCTQKLKFSTPNPSVKAMKTLKKPLSFFAALLFPVALACAGNSWDGGGASGSWSDLSNWDSNTTPVSPTALNFGGTLQLNSTNDLFTAGTTFNGIIFNTDAGAFVIAGNAITLGGNISNSSTSVQTLNLDMITTGTRTIALGSGGGNMVLGGNISGTGGGFNVTGTNVSITITGSNTYTGDTTLGTGSGQSVKLILGDNDGLGTGTLRAGIGAILEGSIDLTGANRIANNVVASHVFSITGTNSIEIGGSYSLNNTGSRALTNTISGGSLILNDVVLNLDTTAGRVLTLDGTGTTVVQGVISNGGASHLLGIGGSATVALENANTYTGGTNLGGTATLILGDKDALGTGQLNVTANATIQASRDLTGANRIANDIRSTAAGGPTFSGTSSIEVGGTFSINNNGDRSLTNNISSDKQLILNNVDISIQAGTQALIIAGSGNTSVFGTIADGATGAKRITITNTGITTFSGTNTYTGTTAVNAGMLVFSRTSAKASGNVTAGASGSIGLGVGGTGFYDSANVDSLFANTLSGFTMNAASGVGIDTSAGDFTYATNQSAGRSLTKLGANKLILTGSNTYSGATIVNAGTLVINGSIAGSGVTVNNGATLGGDGVINTGVTVKSGATLSPGNSPGLLTQGATTLEGGGNYNWQLLDATGDAGIGFDSINLTAGNALTITATEGDEFHINLWTLSGISPDVNGDALNFNSASNYDWTLISTDQTIVGFDATKFVITIGAANGTSGFSNAYTGSFSVALADGGTDLVLVYNAIPEPSTWLLLAGGLTFTMILRRRRA